MAYALASFVEEHWTAHQEPYLLVHAGQALKSRGFDTKNYLRNESLKGFVKRTEKTGKYRLIQHPQVATVVGIIPQGVKFDRSEWSSRVNVELGLNSKGHDRESNELAESMVGTGLNSDTSKTRHKKLPSAAGFDDPIPVEGVPSAFGYTWSTAHTVVIASNTANVPHFPFTSSVRDHALRLESCVVLATELAFRVERDGLNIREEYKDELKKYSSRLPNEDKEGNILLADAAARMLRALFAVESGILPPSFSASLKVLLEQHIGLRPFYPELEVFYRDVHSGVLEEPLPLDAVEGVATSVRRFTPEIFDPTVSAAMGESSPTPIIVKPVAEEFGDTAAIVPPPDPLGELEPEKAHGFQVAGIINTLWRVFLEGEKIHKAGGAWRATYESLAPHIARVIEWLQHFLPR